MINFTAGAPNTGGGKGGSGPSGGKKGDQGTGIARVKLYSRSHDGPVRPGYICCTYNNSH